jgi:hypothetical protein
LLSRTETVTRRRTSPFTAIAEARILKGGEMWSPLGIVIVGGSTVKWFSFSPAMLTVMCAELASVVVLSRRSVAVAASPPMGTVTLAGSRVAVLEICASWV